MSICRIVLVEDNQVDVLLVQEALKHHGVSFTLERYSNGEDAAKAVTAMVEPPALFLIDLNIPRVNGQELLRVIRACPTLDEAPVAILTSSKDPADRTECERLGADAYLIKVPGYHDFLVNVGGAILQLLKRKLSGGCGGRLRLSKSGLVRRKPPGIARERYCLHAFKAP